MTENPEALKLLIRQGPDTIKDTQDNKVCLRTWQPPFENSSIRHSSMSAHTIISCQSFQMPNYSKFLSPV